MTVTIEDSIKGLTREQYDQMLTARGVQVEVKGDQARLEASQATLARAVYEALESGIPSTTIAKVLGIGETSVRRMRDAVESGKF